MKFFFILIFAAIFIVSCDGGLAPIDSELENQTGFGGTITFIGDWSPDITQTNIVLFKDPILSEADFNISNLKYLSTSIPFDSKEYSYNTIDSISFGNVIADKYSYLVVVQTKERTISLDRKDWFVVGVYQSADSGAEPGEITVEKNKFNFDVNIICDFNNLPPQPPGGE